MAYIGNALLILLLLLAGIVLLPFFLVGVIVAGISVAYRAGQHTVTDPILNRGRAKKAATAAGVLLLLLLAAPGFAQTATYDVGKTYSISEGSWVLGHTLGVEAEYKGMTISAARVFSGSRVLETDFALWREAAVGRWTFAGGLNYYRYALEGFDWTWSSGVRFRVR